MKVRVTRAEWVVRRQEKVWNILWRSKHVSGLAAWHGLPEGSNPELKVKRAVVFFVPETVGSAAFVLELCFPPELTWQSRSRSGHGSDFWLAVALRLGWEGGEGIQIGRFVQWCL